MLTLLSSDGVTFDVKESVAMESQTIKNMIDEGCTGIIPLPNVSSKILALVNEYCSKHVLARAAAGADGDAPADATAPTSKAADDELESFDAGFVKVDQTILFELILAANYLDIKGLLDLTCQAVADIIKEKTPEEIRKVFNIENDFSEEEEAAVRRENQWAFE